MAKAIQFREIQSAYDCQTYEAADVTVDATSDTNGPANGKVARGILYSGATTITTPGGASRDLVDTGSYIFVPVQVVQVTAAANDFTLFW